MINMQAGERALACGRALANLAQPSPSFAEFIDLSRRQPVPLPVVLIQLLRADPFSVAAVPTPPPIPSELRISGNRRGVPNPGHRQVVGRETTLAAKLGPATPVPREALRAVHAMDLSDCASRGLALPLAGTALHVGFPLVLPSVFGTPGRERTHGAFDGEGLSTVGTFGRSTIHRASVSRLFDE